MYVKYTGMCDVRCAGPWSHCQNWHTWQTIKQQTSWWQRDVLRQLGHSRCWVGSFTVQLPRLVFLSQPALYNTVRACYCLVNWLHYQHQPVIHTDTHRDRRTDSDRLDALHRLCVCALSAVMHGTQTPADFITHKQTQLPTPYRQWNKWRVIHETTRVLGEAHVPPTKVFPRLAVNKTILKPHVAAATGAQYLYVGFSRRNKIPHCSAYDVGESNPVQASGSGSKANQFVHVLTSVDTQHFIQIRAHIFE